MSHGHKNLCVVCRATPVAMARVDYCFSCWPGGPVTPPPCLRCASRIDYYASGLCRRCHPSAIPRVESCRDCHAWGATRTLGWLCRGCDGWRRQHKTVAECCICHTTAHLSGRGSCRLCHKQASMVREFGKPLDLIGANRYGQQLFFAGMAFQRETPRPPRPPQTPTPSLIQMTAGDQHVLFPVQRDLAARGRAGLPQPPDPILAAELAQRARDHAAQHGWTANTTEDTCHGLRILLGLQDTPGAPIKASEVAALRGIDLPVWTVLEVLADAELLEEDRTPALDAWFDRNIAGLPETMADELRTWFDIMKNGSVIPPRRRPRSPITIRLHLQWALPTLHIWAKTGHTSLREIDRTTILESLPPSGNPRAEAGQALKSIFKILKGQKVLFTNPTVRIKTSNSEEHQLLPADLTNLREAISSPKPAQALVVALIAFHALTPSHIRALQLTDIRDGRLHHAGRTIVLAAPVRARLSAYLDYRNTRWPNSLNPHLFLHYRTAGRTIPVGQRWVKLTIGPGLTATSIRQDRILDEARATDGDARRIVDLFGLSIKAATRYTTDLDHPDLTNLPTTEP
ncbi:hypothetical protein [Amycolatopsis taiwanensis]|uniref:hypothetical protein n=1 Tax=Amycolatopsis taiwanensis TaxID=342230 RepID=UPI001B8050F2|nr:hypothetical protein [Amycolatopsis taiwanensis]